MSDRYLEQLLSAPEPLEPHERHDLEDWLRVLESDCEVFGATNEDTARMNMIKRRLATKQTSEAKL